MNKKKSNTDWYKERWVPLSSGVLKIIAGRRYYQKYMDWLDTKNHVECKRNTIGNKIHFAGSFCRQYRINSDLLASKHNDKRSFRKTTITKYKLLKRIEKIKDHFAKEALGLKRFTPLEPIHEKLLSMVSQARFDMNKAKLIATSYSNDPLISDQLDFLNLINEGKSKWGICDKFGSRLHHHFTSCKRIFRDALYFQEHETERLVMIDIVSSQPYLFSVAISDNSLDTIIPEFKCCKKILDKVREKPDFKLFASLCSDNPENKFDGLYEYWMSVRGIDDRENAKKEIMFLLFSKNVVSRSKKPTWPQLVRDAFKLHFPSVYSLLFEIKRLTEKDLPFILDAYKGKGNYHRNTSCMLQRTEAMTVKNISQKLVDACHTPFLTVFDCWVVLEKNADATASIIINHFKEMEVTPPKLKRVVLGKKGTHNDIHLPLHPTTLATSHLPFLKFKT